MSEKKNIPNFFIVGAPKCGTTALDYHLSLHPEIFMAKKELHYFGSDLGMIHDDLSEDDYLNLFNDTESKIKGESSVWYLYSKKAAKEIKAFNPNAKIIIQLRKPSEMIPSLHSQYVYNGIESLKAFEEAFEYDISNEAKACSLFNIRPKYIDSAMYNEQVQRFLNVFDTKNVLIVLHDDLSRNFNQIYQQTLQFLGVNNTSFLPSEQQINARKEVKNVKLHQISKQPPSKLKSIFRTVVPSKKVRHSIMKWVEERNVTEQKPEGISTATKQRIIELTKQDTLALEKLLNKDLSSWYNLNA